MIDKIKNNDDFDFEYWRNYFAQEFAKEEAPNVLPHNYKRKTPRFNKEASYWLEKNRFNLKYIVDFQRQINAPKEKCVTPKSLISNRYYIPLPSTGRRKRVWVDKQLMLQVEDIVSKVRISKPKQRKSMVFGEFKTAPALYKRVSEITISRFSENKEFDLEKAFNEDLQKFLESRQVLAIT